LSGRLADPAFRNAVESNLAAYPDFDRILHPEKYPPTQAGAPAAPPPQPAPGRASPPASPVQVTPQKPPQRGAVNAVITATSTLAQRTSL